MNTPDQIFAVLKAVKTKPKWPSAVEVPGLNSFNGQHQAEKLKLFEELHTQGLLTRVPGATGVRTGLGFGITEKGLSELKLLSRHPGVKA
jgi:hypothetical protein